jgi:hypothetical protein
MKKVTIAEAVGMALCHDLTRIIPGGMKGAQFVRGQVIRSEDLPLLRSMGKEHLYVWDEGAGLVHEDDAASAIAALCCGANVHANSTIREGKVELVADCDGVLCSDTEALFRLNSVTDVAVAARRNHGAVKVGNVVAALRVIPVAVPPALIEAAGAALASSSTGTGSPPSPVFSVAPFTIKTAAIVATGSEIAGGLIPDRFTPVVTEKLAAFGITVVHAAVVGDGAGDIAEAIAAARSSGAGLVVCTGGMSVDPDDNTPESIRQSGAAIVTYGTPVFPGAMFMLGYYSDGTVIAGLPGCVMHARTTVFDLVLPRIAAGVPLTRGDFAAMGDGGLGAGV